MISLTAQQLTFGFNQTAFYPPLNLTLKAGETWGILGANGCGKTTLLHTLAGIASPLQGKVILNQQKITSLSQKIIAQSIGLLFQEISLRLPQTVWEYCLMARFPHLSYFKKERTEDKHIVTMALNQMALLPLQTKKITQLSGGEKRRLAIAALLAQTPDIYLLDEPTNHLDMRHQMQALTHFQRLAKNDNKIVVMSLHDVNIAAQFCDYFLLLFPHGMTLAGKSSDVLNTENLSALYQYPVKKINGWCYSSN